MRRGTTPTHIFNVDVDLTAAEVVWITYEQNGEEILNKELPDLDIETDKITTTLTQEDTLKFSARYQVSIQIRAKFPDGTVIASRVMRTNTEGILKEGVI